MLSFRSRKTRWPSEVLPQGACLTRIISEGLSVPMTAEWILSLVVLWMASTQKPSSTVPTHKRFDVFLCSLNITLLSSQDWTSCMALYLTQCQPPVHSLGGQIYICFANGGQPLFMSKWWLGGWAGEGSQQTILFPSSQSCTLPFFPLPPQQASCF